MNKIYNTLNQMKKINLKLETLKPHFFYKKWKGKIGANQQLHFTQSWWRPVSSPSWADNCKICEIYTMIISCLIINLCHFSIWLNNVDNYFFGSKKEGIIAVEDWVHLIFNLYILNLHVYMYMYIAAVYCEIYRFPLFLN